jgi:hypothetical protein
VVERNSKRRITRMKHTLQAEDYAPIEAAKENLKYLTK